MISCLKLGGLGASGERLLMVVSESRSVVCGSLWPHGPYNPWNSPGQDTGVSILSLLQGIFPTQGSNPGFPHCRWILYQLSHKGSPRILEWVAYPFSSGSSWPRNWTGVSCIAGGFVTNWALSEVLIMAVGWQKCFLEWKNPPVLLWLQLCQLSLLSHVQVYLTPAAALDGEVIQCLPWPTTWVY